MHILFFYIHFFLFTLLQNDDCKKFNCSPMLGDNVMLLKSHKLLNITDNSTYKIMLSKGTKYRIAGCSDDSKGNLVFELSSEKNGFLFSNYSATSGKYYPYFDYSCNQTGNYSIKYHFENTPIHCGISIISSVK
jgi:hypothetical protein